MRGCWGVRTAWGVGEGSAGAGGGRGHATGRRSVPCWKMNGAILIVDGLLKRSGALCLLRCPCVGHPTTFLTQTHIRLQQQLRLRVRVQRYQCTVSLCFHSAHVQPAHCHSPLIGCGWGRPPPSPPAVPRSFASANHRKPRKNELYEKKTANTISFSSPGASATILRRSDSQHPTHTGALRHS